MTDSLPDLAALLSSWQLALRAERKSPGTIRTYTDGVTKFLRWCDANTRAPELSRVVVQAFLADLLDEGELSANPLVGLKPPKADSKVVNALTDDQLRLFIAACQGKSLQ
ncbi:MAG TPA: phage integrase N-terminal SAM-like domain-containing protein, partial [Mycobacterium sp.]|nr:phage integrase N-terminal SAM-like domain-containing protein [Mycobacterium sp.]